MTEPGFEPGTLDNCVRYPCMLQALTQCPLQCTGTLWRQSPIRPGNCNTDPHWRLHCNAMERTGLVNLK